MSRLILVAIILSLMSRALITLIILFFLSSAVAAAGPLVAAKRALVEGLSVGAGAADMMIVKCVLGWPVAFLGF